ncbi:putative reverse transcriptase domain-containing protein [Tanacetum coccineum]
MSDFEDSTVTYTAMSSPFGGLSDIGSPGVDGPPVMPEDPYAYVVAAFQAPLSPDYVPGPEYPPSPDFVPEPVYLEFIPPMDEVLPAEEQPLPAAVSPTTDSPGYVPEGDDSDDEDESSDDDEDDDVDIEGDEEEEHPAPTDPTTVALPAVIHASSVEETEPFETDESAATPPPHPAYLVTLGYSIRDEPPTPFWSDTKIPSPPQPVSPLPPASPTYPLGYRVSMIWLRAEAPSTSHSPPPHIILAHTREDTPPSGTPPPGTPPILPIPLPTSSPPLHLLSTDYRADIPDVTLPPQKRLGIALGPRYEVGESSSALTTRPPGGFRADYGFVATTDKEIMRDLKKDVGYGITDTWEEMLLDDEQTERQLMAGRLNMLYRDRHAHARTEVMSLRTTVLGQQAVITELQAADRRRQAAITELLAADRGRHAQFIAMIDQGVTAALAARDANRSTNGDDSHVSGTGVRRTERVARDISNCSVENQIKFSSCTLLAGVLTLWNFHVRTVGHDVANWHCCVLECFLKSLTRKRYVGGFPDMIHASVVASKPKTMQEAIKIATELMDKKIRTFAERQTENKRKQDDNHQQQQQQQNKRQNTGRAYTAGSGEKKPYGGSKPLCAKCNYHHDGPCAPKCHKCNRVGHLARDCRSTANANTANNQKGHRGRSETHLL